MVKAVLAVVAPERTIKLEPVPVVDHVEDAAPVKVSAPAEVAAKVPEVAVERVSPPEVLVQEEVPPEASTNAPVELPMLVAAVPVAFIFVVPVTVSPPVPCRSPEPEFTPTNTAAPAVDTDQLSSVRETFVEDAEPMVIVLATAPLPIWIVLALVADDPIWIVSPAVEPIAIVLAAVPELPIFIGAEVALPI